MYSEKKKIIAFLLAVLMTVVLAACSKEESSSTSSQEPQSSESQPEPTPESDPESSEEPETSEESSKDESSEETPQKVSEEDVLGYWEYNIGNEYLGILINDDGTAVYHYTDGTKVDARWEMKDNVISIFVAGGRQDLVYKEEKLTDNYNGQVYFKGTAPDPGEANFDAVGYWEYKTEEEFLGIVIHDDGTAVYKYASGTDINARWEVEDDTLSIFAAGGRQDLVYKDETLVDTYDGHVYVKSTLPDRDEPVENPGGFNPVGLWEFSEGDDYLAIEIYENGTAAYKYASGAQIEAKWSIDSGRLSVFAAGGRQIFTFDEYHLTDTFNGNAYYKAG